MLEHLGEDILDLTTDMSNQTKQTRILDDCKRNMNIENLSTTAPALGETHRRIHVMNLDQNHLFMV